MIVKGFKGALCPLQALIVKMDTISRCTYHGVNSDLGLYILLWQMLLKGCL